MRQINFILSGLGILFLEWLVLPVFNLGLSVYLLEAFVLVCAFLDSKFSNKIMISAALLLAGEAVTGSEWGLRTLAIFFTIAMMEGTKKVVIFSAQNLILSFFWSGFWYYLFEFIFWGMATLMLWGQAQELIFLMPDRDSLLLIRHLGEVAIVLAVLVCYRYFLRESSHG